MQRLPDIFDSSPIKDSFGIIPKKDCFFDDPSLHAKSKFILIQLTTNQGGWVSYKERLIKMNADGATSINNALQELEREGYLVRIRYIDKKTKSFSGSVWCHSPYKYHFDFKSLKKMLRVNGYTINKHDKDKIVQYSTKRANKDPRLGNPNEAKSSPQTPPKIMKSKRTITKAGQKKPTFGKSTCGERYAKSTIDKNTTLLKNQKTTTTTARVEAGNVCIRKKKKNPPIEKTSNPSHNTRKGAKCCPDEIARQTLPKQFFDSKDFLASWHEYQEHRSEVGKPLHKLTSRGLQKQLNMYLREEGDQGLGTNPKNWIESIDQTIAHNWQGLFKAKSNGNGRANYNGGFQKNTYQKQEKPQQKERRLTIEEVDAMEIPAEWCFDSGGNVSIRIFDSHRFHDMGGIRCLPPKPTKEELLSQLGNK